MLRTAPHSGCRGAVTSSDPGEGKISTNTLTFTSANWSTPHVVTITGEDDHLVDGDVAYSIVTSAAVSNDTHYSGLNPPDVSVTNLDNDHAEILVVPTSGSRTTEAGGTATFTVVLSSQPTANVTVGVSSSDLTEATVSPAS